MQVLLKAELKGLPDSVDDALRQSVAAFQDVASCQREREDPQPEVKRNPSHPIKQIHKKTQTDIQQDTNRSGMQLQKQPMQS